MKHKTRVKIGRNDIELSTREPESNVWRKKLLPGDLPNIDLDSSLRPGTRSSPPPGRPGRRSMKDTVDQVEVSEEAKSQA